MAPSYEALAEPETLPPDGDQLPETGQIVHVRARRYLVESVESESVVPDTDDDPDAAEHTLMSLSCLDDDAQGEALVVLWESEVDAHILDSRSVWKEVASRGFDRPDLFGAYLDTLRLRRPSSGLAGKQHRWRRWRPARQRVGWFPADSR